MELPSSSSLHLVDSINRNETNEIQPSHSRSRSRVDSNTPNREFPSPTAAVSSAASPYDSDSASAVSGSSGENSLRRAFLLLLEEKQELECLNERLAAEYNKSKLTNNNNNNNSLDSNNGISSNSSSVLQELNRRLTADLTELEHDLIEKNQEFKEIQRELNNKYNENIELKQENQLILNELNQIRKENKSLLAENNGLINELEELEIELQEKEKLYSLINNNNNQTINNINSPKSTNSTSSFPFNTVSSPNSLIDPVVHSTDMKSLELRLSKLQSELFDKEDQIKSLNYSLDQLKSKSKSKSSKLSNKSQLELNKYKELYEKEKLLNENSIKSYDLLLNQLELYKKKSNNNPINLENNNNNNSNEFNQLKLENTKFIEKLSKFTEESNEINEEYKKILNENEILKQELKNQNELLIETTNELERLRLESEADLKTLTGFLAAGQQNNNKQQQSNNNSNSNGNSTSATDSSSTSDSSLIELQARLSELDALLKVRKLWQIESDQKNYNLERELTKSKLFASEMENSLTRELAAGKILSDQLFLLEEKYQVLENKYYALDNEHQQQQQQLMMQNQQNQLQPKPNSAMNSPASNNNSGEETKEIESTNSHQRSSSSSMVDVSNLERSELLRQIHGLTNILSSQMETINVIDRKLEESEAANELLRQQLAQAMDERDQALEQLHQLTNFIGGGNNENQQRQQSIAKQANPNPGIQSNSGFRRPDAPRSAASGLLSAEEIFSPPAFSSTQSVIGIPSQMRPRSRSFSADINLQSAAEFAIQDFNSLSDESASAEPQQSHSQSQARSVSSVRSVKTPKSAPQNKSKLPTRTKTENLMERRKMLSKSLTKSASNQIKSMNSIGNYNPSESSGAVFDADSLSFPASRSRNAAVPASASSSASTSVVSPNSNRPAAAALARLNHSKSLSISNSSRRQ